MKTKTGRKKRLDNPETLPAEIPVIDRDKFLDALAEALWPRIEQRVQEAVGDAIDNIYISH